MDVFREVGRMKLLGSLGCFVLQINLQSSRIAVKVRSRIGLASLLLLVLKFAIRKTVQGLLMLLVVSAIAFGLLSSAGGDALTALRDNPQVSPETIDRLRKTYGLDRPVIARYGTWLASTVTGDMGESFIFKTPVAPLVLSRLLNTAMLGLAALAIALFASLLLAYLAVRHRSRTIEAIVDLVVLITASTPRIVLSLIALLLMASWSAIDAAGGWWTLSFASLVLAIPLISLFLAQAKSELDLAMAEPFVQFARAKGLSESAVILRHASRAALNPLLSLIGLSLGAVAGGSVIVETVLGWPGIGSLMVAAVRARDVSLVLGIVIVASLAVWFGNTLAELLQLLNDKRLRDAEIN